MGQGLDFFLLPSAGLSGGIMVMWRSNLASFSVVKTSDQCVMGELNVFNRGVWIITTVYASKESVRRRCLWDLVQGAAQSNIPSIIGGDFNCILSKEDKKGGRRFKFNQGSLEMVKFMNENDYHEVGFLGPRFTWHLARVASDHCLIALKVFETDCKGRSGFKFEDTWLSFKEAEHIVANRWRKTFLGDYMEILNKKCKRTLKDLFYWSKNILKEFFLEKDILKAKIVKLQEEESEFSWLTEEKLWLLKAKVKELNLVLNNLNTWWKQRAKAKWINEGDVNTKFFQSFANSRRNANRISQVKYSNGILTEDTKEIEEVFRRFFQGKWKYRNCNFSGWLELRKVLDDCDSELLIKDMEEAEIKEIIVNLGSNKSSGFDGITHSFFKVFWNTIRMDVVNAVKQFFVTGLMNKEWKDTLIVLIPKSPNPSTPSAYRPISLCNSIYKIAAKILLNRMLGIMPRIISEEQAAFVRGRAISDHLFLAQEVFNKMRISKACNGYLAIKVDMEQAYDSMCWSTLEKMMLDIGFPSRFAHLVLECVTTPSCFRMPLLAGTLMWVMKKVRETMRDYRNWTGQNINYHKSSLVCSCSVERRRIKISKFMGIKLVNEFEYLGIKLALRRLRKEDFQVLLDRSSKRINAWGNKFISLAGRLVLIKSVALSLPLFVMTHSLIRMKILLEFEKMCRDFIWNKVDGNRGIHYVSWEQLCKPKQFGGWDVHSVVDRKDAMRAKIAWKLIDKPESLLSRHLIAKYGVDWWSYELSRSSSSTWKIMSSGWKALKDHVRRRIGNGCKIKVLKDTLILDKPLLKWPTFVGYFEDEDASLDGFISDGCWDRGKLGRFFGIDLVDLICEVKIDNGMHEDGMELKHKLSGKSLSALIMQDNFKNQDDLMALSWIYKLGLNERVEIFIWRMVSDALPSGAFLIRRKIVVDSDCPLGCGSVEDINHIAANGCKLRKVLYVLRGWGFQVPVFNSWEDCWTSLQELKDGNLLMNFGRSKNWVVYQSRGLSSCEWQPPPPDWIKINFDASLKGNYEAGFGGIARDYKGRFILAFGIKKMHWDIAQLELSAASAITEIIRDRFDDIGGIIVEGDNKNVRKFLHNLHSTPKKVDRRLDLEESSFLNKCGKIGHLPTSENENIKESSKNVAKDVVATKFVVQRAAGQTDLAKKITEDMGNLEEAGYGPWVHVRYGKKKRFPYNVNKVSDKLKEDLVAADSINSGTINAAEENNIVVFSNSELEEGEMLANYSGFDKNIPSSKISFAPTPVIVNNNMFEILNNVDEDVEKTKNVLRNNINDEDDSSSEMKNKNIGAVNANMENSTIKRKLEKELKTLGPIKLMTRNRKLEMGIKAKRIGASPPPNQ
ncbi:uncharacterized protein LOC110108384 [Dendrobium catenatum]|uniref:uncharacterized protein LOC110108384 n=1 Tax=Dendrobium catenatum TaxID=906689 RepID=UPI0009F38303|nr:uncharacterized protein LOC110108384 [Dendrobium catenatum]